MKKIESRTLITNKAIINEILKLSPRSILDVGCGKGWLLRAIEKEGIHVLSSDAISVFIN